MNFILAMSVSVFRERQATTFSIWHRVVFVSCIIVTLS
jgi:hypothetical protein